MPNARHRAPASRTTRPASAALTILNLTVKDGEFLVLIGLCGSGKSTLLRCINRLVEPTSGRIVLDDVDITAAQAAICARSAAVSA